MVVINVFILWWVVSTVKTLSELGEREAIRRIEALLTKGTNTTGIGDDCAAVDLGDNYLLVTTDMMVQLTHIPVQMTPFQMGWFLVAINLSDIAAKGGTPLGVVCSYGLSKKTSESFLKELTRGADSCAVRFGTTIIGGDTKETQEITLCGTAIGMVKKNEFMPRTGMKPGDVVAVTGTLGKAGVGYYSLKYNDQEKKLSKGLLEPVPRLKEGRMLAMLKSVTSSMDISDGLSSSLYQLQEINAVGFEIDKDALPLAAGLVDFSKKHPAINPYSVAVHFGGDYELLVTIPHQKFEHIKKSIKGHGVGLTAIGVVTKKKGIILQDGKTAQILENRGYEHFKEHEF